MESTSGIVGFRDMESTKCRRWLKARILGDMSNDSVFFQVIYIFHTTV